MSTVPGQPTMYALPASVTVPSCLATNRLFFKKQGLRQLRVITSLIPMVVEQTVRTSFCSFMRLSWQFYDKR